MLDENLILPVIDPWLGHSVTVVAIEGTDEGWAETSNSLLIHERDFLRLVATRSTYEALALSQAALAHGCKVAALMGSPDIALCQRAARLVQKVDRGQFLINLALHDVIRGASLELEFSDFGTQDFAGRQERLFILAPNSTAPDPSARPIQQTFIGRAKELLAARTHFEHGRLLTVHGFPGVGKSQFIKRLSAEMEDTFPDGRLTLDLRSVSRQEVLWAILQQGLDAIILPGETSVSSILNTLRAREVLLVLDNVDQCMKPVRHLASEILADCPNVVVLVGSHRALKLSGEHRFQLFGLEVPSEHEDWKAIREADAVRLFEERARLNNPDFAIDRENAGDVAALCRHLEGIPSHIEMSVNRLTALTPRGVLNKLKDRVGMPLHVHELAFQHLTPNAKTLLRRLSIFRGEFAIHWAFAVCSLGDLDDTELLLACEELVEAAVIKVTGIKFKEKVFTLGTMTRNFATLKLTESGELASVKSNYLEWTRNLVEKASDTELDRDRAMHIEMFDAAYFDLLESIFEGIRKGETVEQSVETGLSCLIYLMDRGSFRQGFALARRLCEAPRAKRTEQFARLLSAASSFAFALSDAENCQRYARRSLRLALAGRDAFRIGAGWCSYALAFQMQGRNRSAFRCHTYSLAQMELAEDRGAASTAATNRLSVAIRFGDPHLVQSVLDDALRAALLSQSPIAIAHVKMNAAHYYLDHFQPAQSLRSVIDGLHCLGSIEEPVVLSRGLANAAYALYQQSKWNAAAYCMSASYHLMDQFGFYIDPEDVDRRKACVQELIERIGVSEYESIERTSKSESVQDIVEFLEHQAIT